MDDAHKQAAEDARRLAGLSGRAIAAYLILNALRLEGNPLPTVRKVVAELKGRRCRRTVYRGLLELKRNNLATLENRRVKLCVRIDTVAKT